MFSEFLDVLLDVQPLPLPNQNKLPEQINQIFVFEIYKILDDIRVNPAKRLQILIANAWVGVLDDDLVHDV
jgi:hypothetical protein